MKYRQTIVPYVVNYVLWKWILAFMTLGIVPVMDFLRFKRHTLELKEKAVALQFGVFTQNSSEVFYRNIQGVNVHQSVLGQMFSYGDIIITTANQSDSIVFKNVDSPQVLRHAIQDKIL